MSNTTEKDIVDTVVKELNNADNAGNTGDSAPIDGASDAARPIPTQWRKGKLTLGDKAKAWVNGWLNWLDARIPRLVWKGQRIDAAISFSGDGFQLAQQLPAPPTPVANNGKKAKKAKAIPLTVTEQPLNYYSIVVDHDTRFDGMGPYVVVNGSEWRNDNSLYGRTRVYFKGVYKQ